MKRILVTLATAAIVESAVIIFGVEYPANTPEREWLLSVIGLPDIEFAANEQ